MMDGIRAFEELRRRLEQDTDAGQFAAACRDLRGREFELTGCTAAQALALRDVVGPAATGLTPDAMQAFERLALPAARAE